MDVYDSRHARVRLGNHVGRGGEAVVYEVIGQPDRLVKIYKRNRLGQDQKLTWMLANPPNDPTRAQGHAAIAWPLGLLYNDQGQFVGYLMPNIRNSVLLLHVLNPRLRTRTFPGFDWRYQHRAARNLARSLGAIHERGYVVGDLNESNVMVTPSALVTLIDTDSFQVQEQNGARLLIYPCPVGKLEYTPQELQGRSFRGTQRLPEHDNFGLGVLIFQLLMDGSHPFRAQWKGRGDPLPLEERIRCGCFPYSESPPCPVAPPRNAPSLDTLYPRVADLVWQCFDTGHEDPRSRPSPAEWERAIVEAEAHLLRCRNGHYYSDHRSSCARCGAQAERSSRRSLLRLPRLAIPAFAAQAGSAAASQAPSVQAVARQAAEKTQHTMGKTWGHIERAVAYAFARTPSVMQGLRWMLSGALEGAICGLIVWAIAGMMLGLIGGIVPESVFRVFLAIVGGAAAGAVVGVSICDTQDELKRPFMAGGALVGALFGWLVVQRGFGFWTNGTMGVAGALEGVIVGSISGALAGVVVGSIVGAIGRLITRATNV